MPNLTYLGRFAPSPTGPLHEGSVLAAMASYIDARVHGGSWLLRIEDVDTTRRVPGIDSQHLSTLETLGFEWHGEVLRQSERTAIYESYLDLLRRSGRTYRCVCSRSTVISNLTSSGRLPMRDRGLIYPGTCRDRGLDQTNAAIRFKIRDIDDQYSSFQDRWLGPQNFNLRELCGDFVLKRSDGICSYQLAVVIDDSLQGVTHVVRGADLLDNTPRQQLLLGELGFHRPTYAHVHVVKGADGAKLSKQNGAQALDLRDPVKILKNALAQLADRKIPLPPNTQSVIERPDVGSASEFWAALFDQS